VSVMLPRSKLAAVLGLLGSEHDGEVVAAGRMAERIRREANVTWSDIIAPPGGPGSRSADVPPAWDVMVAVCRAGPAGQTLWERHFLSELSGYRHAPSERQRDILARIYARVTR
jgi:hypothetical protein